MKYDFIWPDSWNRQNNASHQFLCFLTCAFFDGIPVSSASRRCLQQFWVLQNPTRFPNVLARSIFLFLRDFFWVNASCSIRQVFFCGRDCQKEAWIAAKRKVKAKTVSWFGDSRDASLSFALTLCKTGGRFGKRWETRNFHFWRVTVDYKAWVDLGYFVSAGGGKLPSQRRFF